MADVSSFDREQIRLKFCDAQILHARDKIKILRESIKTWKGIKKELKQKRRQVILGSVGIRT